MFNWVKADLELNQLPWVIVMVHHPPYSKGSHNSNDFLLERESFYMRERFLPLFDSLKVDLVLSGHSHNYERSFLIEGHYGRSSSFNPVQHLVSGKSGAKAAGEEYRKAGRGIVYCIVGNSGAYSEDNGVLHPVMFIDYAGIGIGGSMLLDINGSELSGTYYNQDGEMIDQFSILKDNSTSTHSNVHHSKKSEPIDFTLYPNPSTEWLNISYQSKLSGAAKLLVYSIDGTLVCRVEEIIDAGAGQLVIQEWDVLPSGTYVIAILFRGQEYFYKAVKSR